VHCQIVSLPSPEVFPDLLPVNIMSFGGCNALEAGQTRGVGADARDMVTGKTVKAKIGHLDARVASDLAYYPAYPCISCCCRWCLLFG
jgi:hypothetical protein